MWYIVKDTYTPNVAGRREPKATNETGTHIREDITVKVGHDHHTVRKRARVLDDLTHAYQLCSFQNG